MPPWSESLELSRLLSSFVLAVALPLFTGLGQRLKSVCVSVWLPANLSVSWSVRSPGATSAFIRQEICQSPRAQDNNSDKETPTKTAATATATDFLVVLDFVVGQSCAAHRTLSHTQPHNHNRTRDPASAPRAFPAPKQQHDSAQTNHPCPLGPLISATARTTKDRRNKANREVKETNTASLEE